MIYIVLADGFEEIEALTPYNLMCRAKLPVKFVSLGNMRPAGCTCGHVVECNISIEDAIASPDKIDLLMFPGGLPGAYNCDEHPLTSALIEKAQADGAYFAAICAAPMVYGKRGMLRGIHATSYPDFRQYLEGAIINPENKVEVDGKFITAAGMGNAFPFAVEIIRCLCGDETAMAIKNRVQG